MACLDTAGMLTVRNLNNPEVVIQQRKINFKSDNVKLLKFFYKGNTNKILTHWKNESTTTACLIDYNTSTITTQLEAHAPLLADQMDGNIWLLDSDERWKYYSNS